MAPTCPPAAKAAVSAGDTPRREVVVLAPSTPAAMVPETKGVDSPRGSEGSAGDCSCAICLERADLEELAIVKGCDHTYCVKCILRWASHREQPTCPQCKQPFEHLFTYRALNGSLHEFPQEESVTLLKRACWFTEYMQVAEQGRAILGADDGSSVWRDYEPYFEEYDDDDEVEAYYMSSAAGHARVVFGNRRWGNSGYVAGGRQLARPSQPPRSKGPKGKGGSGTGTAASGAPPGSGTKGRRSSGASSGSSLSSSAKAPGASSCEADTAAAAMTAAAHSVVPITQAVPPPVQLPTMKSMVGVSSLLTRSLAQAGATTQPSVPIGAETARLPVPPSGVDRSINGFTASSSFSGSERVTGFSPGNGLGSGSFLYGTSPGAASCGSSHLGSSPGSGMEGGVPGRRARRALRRAAEDAVGGAGGTPLPSPVPISWESSV